MLRQNGTLNELEYCSKKTDFYRDLWTFSLNRQIIDNITDNWLSYDVNDLNERIMFDNTNLFWKC